MSVSRRYSISAVAIGATALCGVVRENISTGSQLRGEPTSGEVFNRYLSLTAQNPTASFGTQHIASALTLLGSLGLDIDDLTGGVKLYGTEHERGSTRKTGSNHRVFTINDGLIYPVRLSCDYQGDVELEVMVAATYDGTNSPIIPADSTALPTITDNERYTLGPVTIGGVALTHLRRLELDFGLTVEAIGGAGGTGPADIWPTFASIVRAQPVLTLRGIDAQWFKTSGAVALTGLAATHANSAFYLRKRSRHSTFVADATTEHVQFTLDGMAVIEDAFGGDPSSEAETSLRIPLSFDGTNNPIVIDTTAAIS